MSQTTPSSAHGAELIEWLSVHELAACCRTSIDWVHAHVQAGVLVGESHTSGWRFESTTLVRARRIAELEHRFDADPQLAALTTDLIEEVTRLRAQLAHLQHRQDGQDASSA